MTDMLLHEVFGKMIRQRRRVLDLTQVQAAALAKVSSINWSRMERGDSNISLDEAARRAKCLGIDLVAWFTEGGDGHSEIS